METINWKQKLSSRKFWTAVAAFVSALLFAFNVAESDATQITAIIMAGGALIAYIFSEGWVDANREGGDNITTYINSVEDTEDDI